MNRSILGLFEYIFFSMPDEILKLLKSLDTKFDSLDKRVTSLDTKFDTKFDSLDKRVTSLDTKFDSLGEQLEVVVKEVLDHTDRFDRIEAEIRELTIVVRESGKMEKIDQTLKKALDVEQEGNMRTHAIRRLQDEVDQNTADINLIKPLVGLA